MKLQDNRQSTSCAAEALVRTFQSPDSSVDSTVIEAACLSNKCVLPANSEQNLSFGKMFQESYPQIKVEILNASYVPSQVGDKSISKNGQMLDSFVPEERRNTPCAIGYLIRGFSESPNGGGESSLSQVLETTPDRKYSLSPMACAGIL